MFDALFIRKEADGTFSGFDLAELDKDRRRGPHRVRRATTGLLGDDDVAPRRGRDRAGQRRVMIVYENRWAAPFIAAVRRNGGVLIANERIGVQELIDALDAAESAA